MVHAHAVVLTRRAPEGKRKVPLGQQVRRSFDRFKEILGSMFLSVTDSRWISEELTKMEMGCNQPDREGLAVVFGLTKFYKILNQIFGSRKSIPVPIHGELSTALGADSAPGLQD